MAGYTDPPYRELMKEFRIPVLFTEMIDSHALVHRNDKTSKMLGRRDQQLFTQIAAGTAVLADGALSVLLEEDIRGINLNMGCPAKKVVSCGGGSNLLRHPTIIRDICRNVRKRASHIPFSVKFRSGWDMTSLNFLEVGKIFEDEGVDFVILHARTRTQAFSGRAHWNHIRMLKDHLRIPVIGNGDVVSYETAKAMVDASGCDGIAIGRGVIGNPWLYLQAAAALEGDAPLKEPSIDERFRIITRHYELILDYFGSRLSTHIFRKHLVGYLKGLPGQKLVKEELFKDEALSLERLKDVLGEYFLALKTGLSLPNVAPKDLAQTA